MTFSSTSKIRRSENTYADDLHDTENSGIDSATINEEVLIESARSHSLKAQDVERSNLATSHASSSIKRTHSMGNISTASPCAVHLGDANQDLLFSDDRLSSLRRKQKNEHNSHDGCSGSSLSLPAPHATAGVCASPNKLSPNFYGTRPEILSIEPMTHYQRHSAFVSPDQFIYPSDKHLGASRLMTEFLTDESVDENYKTEMRAQYQWLENFATQNLMGQKEGPPSLNKLAATPTDIDPISYSFSQSGLLSSSFTESLCNIIHRPSEEKDYFGS